MNRIRVALFEDRVDAESVLQRLGELGIAAEVHDELGLAKLWFASKRRSGVRLEIRTKDAAEVRRLLRQWDAVENSLQKAIHCPECKSLRVAYPQFTQKSLLTNLTIGLVAGLGLVQRKYYCEDCHWMWANPSRNPRSARLLDDSFPGFGQPVGAGASAQPATADCRSAGHTFTRGLGKRCAAVIGGDSRGEARRSRRTWKGYLGDLSLLGTMFLLAEYGAARAASAPWLSETSTTIQSASEPLRANTTTDSNGRQLNSVSPTYFRDVLPIFMGKCARCHNDESFLHNWLDYGPAAAKRWEIKRRVWDSWRGAYFKQPMPTGNSPESVAMSEEERTTIRDWVQSGAPLGAPLEPGTLQSKAERVEAGKRLFGSICAACHQPTGGGIPGRFPPLAGSDFLNSDKHRAIKALIHGLQGEIVVNGQKFNNSMPKFPLSDGDIASALTYVYNTFGNSGQEVTAQEVKMARAEGDEPNSIAPPQTAKSAAEPSPYE